MTSRQTKPPISSRTPKERPTIPNKPASQSFVGKTVDWEDEFGRKYKMLIPLDAPIEYASRGVRVGPPDIESLGLPLELEVRLNNQLFNRKLITERDIRLRPNDLVAAMMATYKVDAQKVATLYVVD